MPLVKARTELRPDWKTAPLAFWVHREEPSRNWYGSTLFDPPAPKAHGRKGFPFLVVDYGPHTLQFSSREQLAHFIDVLSTSPLPTTTRLSRLRGTTKGPNGHWLSRLPAALKKPKERERLVAALRGLPADVWRVIPNRSPK